MSILIDNDTAVLVQGITGREGGRAVESMLEYGTKVLAGVTPGKGGMTTEHGVPVFNTVQEACTAFPLINTSLVVVPARFAENALCEAISNELPLVVVLTEEIPVLSVSRLLCHAQAAGVRIVGPSSVGIITPGVSKVGSVGMEGLDRTIFSPGRIGVVSKSGGMTAELARVLTEYGIGQSTALGIGGDVIIGSTFVDIFELFESDGGTDAVVLFGEVGGAYEEEAAEAMKQGRIKKPVISLLAGRFSETLPQGTTLGHAGAIVSRGRGSYASKVKALSEAGAFIARTPEEIPVLLKDIL